MTVRLVDIASVIRSKNAGPYELTLDIVFSTPEWFARAVAADAIDAALVARRYGLPVEDVLQVIWVPAAAAVKINLRRGRVAGDVGETDVYGAQQHAPLLDLELDL